MQLHVLKVPLNKLHFVTVKGAKVETMSEALIRFLDAACTFHMLLLLNAQHYCGIRDYAFCYICAFIFLSIHSSLFLLSYENQRRKCYELKYLLMKSHVCTDKIEIFPHLHPYRAQQYHMPLFTALKYRQLQLSIFYNLV